MNESTWSMLDFTIQLMRACGIVVIIRGTMLAVIGLILLSIKMLSNDEDDEDLMDDGVHWEIIDSDRERFGEMFSKGSKPISPPPPPARCCP